MRDSLRAKQQQRAASQSSEVGGFLEEGHGGHARPNAENDLDLLLRQKLPNSWLGATEPPWQYGLAEVLFQLLDNNGQLPLLAAYETFKDSRRPFATAYELDLWPPTELRLRQDEEEDKREVDLVVSDGYRLWVGEAGISDHFGPGDAELLRLRELAQLGDALDADGVLAVTSQPALRSTTRGRLRTALDELRVGPLLREVGGIALRPELPPLREAVNPDDTLDGNEP